MYFWPATSTYPKCFCRPLVRLPHQFYVYVFVPALVCATGSAHQTEPLPKCWAGAWALWQPGSTRPLLWVLPHCLPWEKRYINTHSWHTMQPHHVLFPSDWKLLTFYVKSICHKNTQRNYCIVKSYYRLLYALSLKIDHYYTWKLPLNSNLFWMWVLNVL